jgi:hypothetical protein
VSIFHANTFFSKLPYCFSKEQSFQLCFSLYRVFRAQDDWTLTHTSHKGTEQRTIEASISLECVTLTDSLITWSPNKWPSIFHEIPVSADKMFWTSNMPAKWTFYTWEKEVLACFKELFGYLASWNVENYKNATSLRCSESELCGNGTCIFGSIYKFKHPDVEPRKQPGTCGVTGCNAVCKRMAV